MLLGFGTSAHFFDGHLPLGRTWEGRKLRGVNDTSPLIDFFPYELGSDVVLGI